MKRKEKKRKENKKKKEELKTRSYWTKRERFKFKIENLMNERKEEKWEDSEEN